MKKALLILFLSVFGSVAFAQGSAPKEPEAPKPVEKKETPAPSRQDAKKEEVKAVPAAKNAAKPQRVAAKPAHVRQSMPRPARNPRPAARPVRPGRGR